MGGWAGGCADIGRACMPVCTCLQWPHLHVSACCANVGRRGPYWAEAAGPDAAVQGNAIEACQLRLEVDVGGPNHSTANTVRGSKATLETPNFKLFSWGVNLFCIKFCLVPNSNEPQIPRFLPPLLESKKKKLG